MHGTAEEARMSPDYLRTLPAAGTWITMPPLSGVTQLFSDVVMGTGQNELDKTFSHPEEDSQPQSLPDFPEISLQVLQPHALGYRILGGEGINKKHAQ